MVPRSYLFVPGNRPERFDKALAGAAHAVILDLEDAVPPQDKDMARALVASWLSASRPVVLRINAVQTTWHENDLAVCRLPGVAAVMVAKAEHADQLAALDLDVPLIPLIESAAGLDQARSMAGVRGVTHLAFGAIDFQLDLNMQAEFDDLNCFRSQLVLVSRLAGIGSPIDSPSVALQDSAQVEREAKRARRLGFGAKLCIHPNQLEVVNRSFRPTEAEIIWARQVLAAANASGGAAVALEGRMIDTPVILRARGILDNAEE